MVMVSRREFGADGGSDGRQDATYEKSLSAETPSFHHATIDIEPGAMCRWWMTSIGDCSVSRMIIFIGVT
jgi:hypothetical protein